MPIRTFDPSLHVVLVNGVPLTGFAPDKKVIAKRTADSFSKVTDVDGNVTRVAMKDKSGEVTVSLSNTSPSNAYLSGIALADELTGTGTFTFAIQDATGQNTCAAAVAWIKKRPDYEVAKEQSVNEWNIETGPMLLVLNGTLLL